MKMRGSVSLDRSKSHSATRRRELTRIVGGSRVLRGAVGCEGKREKPRVCAGVYVPCILELEGLGGTLLEVVVLLIMHRKSRGGLRGDSGLEDCSGLGGGVVRKNIPLIQTTYILLAGREHESAQGAHDQRSMAKGRCGQQTLESRRVVVRNDSRLGS